MTNRPTGTPIFNGLMLLIRLNLFIKIKNVIYTSIKENVMLFI
jgi:hypothetical protein